MKKQIKICGVLAIIMAFFVISCSKDDNNSETEPIELNGGDVYRYQMVTIDLPNTTLSENEYEVKLGETFLNAIKVDEHQLSFLVPSDFSLGSTELLIPSLNNTKIKYNILQTILEQSVDETIMQFTSLGDSFIANMTVPDPNNNYEKFKNFYENNATAEQKEQMALCYYANKEAFDSLITFDPENLGGRFTSNDAIIVSKFLFAIGAGGASIWVMYSQIPADPAGAILAAGAAYFFYIKAKNYGTQVANIPDVKTTGFSLGGFLGENNKNVNSAISLNDNVEEQLSFQLQGRALTQNDSGTSHQTISSFFNKMEYLNDFIIKTNTAIEWINNNVPLVDFSPFDLMALQTNPVTVSTNVDGEAMQDISFSISHPNLQLINASLSSAGELNLKVKITGSPTSTPIVSTLNYSYNDSFSSFTGHFNIEVDGDFSLVGGWELINGDGLDVEVWSEPTCPRWRYLSGNISFTDIAFSGGFSSESEGTETDTNGDIICSPIITLNESIYGGYQSNSDTFLLEGTYNGPDGIADLNGVVSVIDNDNISVSITVDFGGGDVSSGTFLYTRQ